MRSTIRVATAASLVLSQLASTAAMAQMPTRLPPQERPVARPAPAKKPPTVTRPAPKPSKPDGGFGGSGGSSGGNRPDFGGSGGSGGSRPDFGGSGGSSGGNRPDFGGSGGSSGGNRPGFGGSGGSWGNNGSSNWNNWHGRIVRCESWNYRYARCNLDVRGGVRLVRVIAGDCRQGRNWGWSTAGNHVWVNRGCRADFQARYGNWGGGNNDRPNNAGAVIAGVAVAAGLLAILASKGRNAENGGGSAQMAAINIPPGSVPSAAERSFRLCTQEAARQIGATGGTAIRLLGSVDAAPANGGWHFQMPLEASWPGDAHATPAFCRATNSKVVELSFYQG